ncbi:hypothetical protein EJ04DRAFT_543720 [Polyplosphaeria fusca]|uniref:Uncharacterized protein n=1 Tax=Polyplosphaeria fusca TaxID=682080 RepID=A0A9P4QZZ3_9PLEO|nr:hypothetical protein EJ04DRAFT_543720 [Polyplosphaeria fusca]
MAISDASVAAKSTHLADASLRPFLQPTFDPTDYLNDTLPSLAVSSVSRPLKQGTSASLADLSSQTQDLLSQLNAQTTRLSTILTQLTDDILRSGGRLAYEVEVLRGETTGLSETLTDELRPDIERFLPGGVVLPAKEVEATVTSPLSPSDPSQREKQETDETTQDDPTPEYIRELRTLSTIRTRLETVIKVFGEAMHWTLPPSEVSLTSSLISVSGPTADSSPDLERKGKEFATQLRSEISDLITGDDAGTGAAIVRIQALRDLATVWKGTAEEKARTKFVESLVRLAEERQKQVEKEAAQRQRAGRNASIPKRSSSPQKSGGFLDNLQKIF